MHSLEQKRKFAALRGQGWSLAKIAARLNIPKPTLWRWDKEDSDTLQFIKAIRFEELQEKFVPTYEEELAQLSSYRDRIRKALSQHDFSAMKAEFLLQIDLQISSRLARFRADLPLHSPAPIVPVSLPGCLSRTPLEPPPIEPVAAAENGTFRDETPPGSKRDASASTTSSDVNGTAVPFSARPETGPPSCSSHDAVVQPVQQHE